MEYKNTVRGIFVSRPNRFIAEVQVGDEIKICHVKNTGRCRELLLPGARVILEHSAAENRKTEYDLIAVYKDDMLINIDSQAPNKVFGEWISSGGFISSVDCIRPECRYGDSRFDFYIEARGRRIFAEIKGVTLERDGIAMFPDAPTERGVKHIRELMAAVREGYEACVVFVVQMENCRYFTPNRETHPALADALIEARAAGVGVFAFSCHVTESTLRIAEPVEVRI